MARKKNPHAVALGRKGGQKGGPARAKKLTRQERAEIAAKASHTYWNSPAGLVRRHMPHPVAGDKP